jgi:hypothetical protein
MNKLEILERLAIRLESSVKVNNRIKEDLESILFNDIEIACTEELIVKYYKKENKIALETKMSNLEITQEVINNIHEMSVNVNIAKIQLDQLKEREEADDSITKFKEDAHIDEDDNDPLIERETVKEKMDKKVKENAKKNLENEKLVKQIFKGNYKNYFNNGKRVKRYMIDSYNLKLFTKDGELNCNSLHEIMATVIPVNKKVNQNLVFIDDKRQIRYLVKCEDIKNMNLGIKDEVKLKYKQFNY